MAQPRTDLQAILEEILGSSNVYFQPPESQVMQYPAIVYNRDRSFRHDADDKRYLLSKGYQVTYLDWDPDSPVLDALEALPYCSFVRHYVSDGLNHDVFLIYF